MRALIGIGLLLVGAGAVVVSTALGSGSGDASVLGGNQPVNAGAGDPRDITAHNSPSLVRSPVAAGELAVANRIDIPGFGCALHFSSDGGASWQQIAIPAPEGEQPKCYAPDVAFDADGTLYLSFVTLKGRGNVPNAVWIASMRRGERVLSAPVKVLGRLAFQVRLVADPTSPRELYLSWLQGSGVGVLGFAGPGAPIRSMRSDDGGASWTKPALVSSRARQRVVAPTPAVGSGDDVYVLYLDLADDRLDYEGGHRGQGGPPYAGRWKLVLARSRDGGITWEESVVDEQLVPSERIIAFIPPYPALAVDRRHGILYAGYQDARSGDADVRVWKLPEGASSWQGPVRVNDTPPADGTSQYRPQLSVAPDGRLDVVYYDRRDDKDDVHNEVSLQSSYDEGATFTPRTPLSEQPFDSRVGLGIERGLPDLGSRLALLSTDTRAFAVWTDTRNGTVSSGKQDIARAVVAISEPDDFAEAVRYALRYGGLALTFAGLLLFAPWVIRAAQDLRRKA